METGLIVIHLAAGQAVVARTMATDAGGTRLLPATNATDLAETARDSLIHLNVDLQHDGVYPCPTVLKQAAIFPPDQLPPDPISIAEARNLLFPDLNDKAGWARIHRLVERGELQAYRLNDAGDSRRFVSRQQVEQLRETRHMVEA